MDLFSIENCVRGEMQSERGNPYVADDIRRVCIGKRGSMRSLRENHERPFVGNPCFFDRKSSVRKVSANGCPRCTLDLWKSNACA